MHRLSIGNWAVKRKHGEVNGMVAVDVTRRISARQPIPPRHLGGCASCDDSRADPVVEVLRALHKARIGESEAVTPGSAPRRLRATCHGTVSDLYSEVFDLKPTSGEILKSGSGHLSSVILQPKKTRPFCSSFWLYETVSGLLRELTERGVYAASASHRSVTRNSSTGKRRG